MGLEELLLGLTALLFVAQILAWRWSRRVERQLLGQHGYELARTITWIIGWSLIARAVGTAAVAALGIDRNHMDAALFLALMAQIGGAIIFVGAALRIRRFSRNDEEDALDPSDPEWGEGLEGIGIEIDQVGVGAAVAVDDANSNTALSGTH